MSDPFVRRVSEGMRRSGLTLRAFCREVDVDPSFFSKVLSGKRSPPAEEEVLRRIAERLSLDAAELIVSAGRIPSEWRAVSQDSDLFRSMHDLAVARKPVARVQAPPRASAGPSKKEQEEKADAGPVYTPLPRREISEELL